MSWFNRVTRVEVEVVVEKTVEKLVLGTPERRKFFLAKKIEVYLTGFAGGCIEVNLGYFDSAEQAFKAHPGCSVKEAYLWKVGDVWVSDLTVTRAPAPVRGEGVVA